MKIAYIRKFGFDSIDDVNMAHVKLLNPDKIIEDNDGTKLEQFIAEASENGNCAVVDIALLANICMHNSKTSLIKDDKYQWRIDVETVLRELPDLLRNVNIEGNIDINNCGYILSIQVFISCREDDLRALVSGVR